MKLSQETVAVYSIGTVLIGAALWLVTATVTQAEFDQHVSDKQCERATDRWIKKRNQLDERPEDKKLIQDERQALKDQEQQCGKKS